MIILCPKCKKELKQIDRSFQCENRHSYDVAKQGYVNLYLTHKKITGDNQLMVNARTRFLNNGHYQQLCNSVIETLSELNLHTLVDAGCGEGYYTNSIKEKLNLEIYGFDLSKYALKEAARKKNGVFYAVSSVYELPLEDACTDGVLSIFAPVAEKEVCRVLHENGYFVKVEPAEHHLYEMKQVLYEDVYLNEEEPVLYEGFELVERKKLSYMLKLESAQEIQDLFMMTPYYYRSPKKGVEQLNTLEYLETTAEFYIDVYKKNK